MAKKMSSKPVTKGSRGRCLTGAVGVRAEIAVAVDAPGAVIGPGGLRSQSVA